MVVPGIWKRSLIKNSGLMPIGYYYVDLLAIFEFASDE
jgi:hypothetical protein